MFWRTDLNRVFNNYKYSENNYPLLKFERKGRAKYKVQFLGNIIEPLDDTIHTAEEQEKQAMEMDEESLKSAASKRSKQKMRESIITITQRLRDPYISEYAKRRAGGICQLCGESAPFLDKKGRSYLESHHIKWISRGGEDSVENTVALCPNCHRKMHVVDDFVDVDYLINVNGKNMLLEVEKFVD